MVTAFEFQLHEQARQVISGSFSFPWTQAQQVLEFGAEYAAQAPDDLMVSMFVGAVPPEAKPIVSISVGGVGRGSFPAQDRLAQASSRR